VSVATSGAFVISPTPAYRCAHAGYLLPKVAAEMALSVLAYNLTRVMNIVGTKPLMAAIVA
jgi:hypothetical protein